MIPCIHPVKCMINAFLLAIYTGFYCVLKCVMESVCMLTCMYVYSHMPYIQTPIKTNHTYTVSIDTHHFSVAKPELLVSLRAITIH